MNSYCGIFDKIGYNISINEKQKLFGIKGCYISNSKKNTFLFIFKSLFIILY